MKSIYLFPLISLEQSNLMPSALCNVLWRKETITEDLALKMLFPARSITRLLDRQSEIKQKADSTDNDSKPRGQRNKLQKVNLTKYARAGILLPTGQFSYYCNLQP